MDINPSEEEIIVAGCKNNESWARKKLYELYAPAMLGICVRYMNDSDKAKDILHEGFIRVFSKINSYNATGSLGGWMRRVFSTTAIEFLRSNHSWQRMDINDYEEKIEDVEISAVENLSAEEILKCISELPKSSQLIFNMHAIEGYSLAEIARMLNINEGTSRSQFARARQLLQNKIKIMYSNEYKKRQIK